MFPDAFLPNLGVFLLGQLAAFGCLRLGLVRRGVLLLLLQWVLLDAALLLRFAHGEVGIGYVGPLTGMQVVALGSAAWFGYWQWRRRYSRTARQRDQIFAQGQQQYLRDDLPAAFATFRRLHRHDPADVPAAIAFAAVLAARGQPRMAARVLHSARALDRDREYADLLEFRLQQVAPARAR